jgi:hypothetical protein
MIKYLFTWWVEKGETQYILSKEILISDGFEFFEYISLINKTIKLRCRLLDLEYSLFCHVDDIQILCLTGRIQNSAGFMIMCEIALDEFISFLIE